MQNFGISIEMPKLRCNAKVRCIAQEFENGDKPSNVHDAWSMYASSVRFPSSSISVYNFRRAFHYDTRVYLPSKHRLF